MYNDGKNDQNDEKVTRQGKHEGFQKSQFAATTRRVSTTRPISIHKVKRDSGYARGWHRKDSKMRKVTKKIFLHCYTQ